VKFKFKLDRKTLLRIACIFLVIALLPFSMELVLLIDIGGIDFAITFLMIYLASAYQYLLGRWFEFRKVLREFVLFTTELYMFKPKVFVSHASASGIIMAATCSLFLVCLFLIPVIYMSSVAIA
jgi:hypothetical protein